MCAPGSRDPEPHDDRRQRPLQGRRAPARGGANARAGGGAQEAAGKPASSSGSASTSRSPATSSAFSELFGLHELAVEDAQQSTPAAKDRGLRRGRLHRPEDRPLPRGSRGGPFRRDPPLRRPRVRDHGAAWARAASLHSARQSLEATPGPAPARGHVGRLGDSRQGRRRLHPGRRRDRGRRRGGREGRLRRRHPGPDGPHLQPEARGDRVPSCCLAAAQPSGDAGAGRLRARARRSCAATFATSPITPSGSTSR